MLAIFNSNSFSGGKVNLAGALGRLLKFSAVFKSTGKNKIKNSEFRKIDSIIE